MENREPEISRRRLMRGVGIAGIGALSVPAWPQEKEEELVTPNEDLMREHGVLKRILLVYDEGARRIEVRDDLDIAVIRSAAQTVRSFVEDYHEGIEEQYLFPRFKKKGVLVDLVDVLLAQHQAGRRVTDIVLRYATREELKDSDSRVRIVRAMRQFVRMYEPHEAREDTVLFPQFSRIVSRNEYDALGEEFEDKEHDYFGADGFERIVDKVAGMEKKLGIYDLAQFTPKG